MRKTVYAAVMLIFLFVPALSAAAQAPYSLQPYRNLEMGMMFHHFDYEEDLPAPLKSTEDGWLPGFYVGWDRNRKNALYTKLYMEISSGDVTYDGTTQTGEPVHFSVDNTQFLFRGEFNLGYNFPVSPNLSFIPYIGYGYRYWSRGQAKVTQAYQSYSESYRWHYLPVGIKADFNPGGPVSVAPNIGLRIMFYGTMTAYFSDLDHRYSNPEFDLGNEVGWYAEVPVKIKLSRMWSLVVKPWYEHSKIGKSDDVDVWYRGQYEGTYYEPSSKTVQYGINVGLVYTY